MEELGWRSRQQRLRELIGEIVNKSSEDDENLEFLSEATETLEDLEFMRVKKPSTERRRYAHQTASGSKQIPVEFLCPISKKLMTDPVIISTGVTCDRASINRGILICPKSGKTIENTKLFTPNLVIKDLIAQFVGVGPRPSTRVVDKKDPFFEKNHEALLELVIKLSPSTPLPDQRDAARSLRLLAAGDLGVQIFLGGFISDLLRPVEYMHTEKDIDTHLEEHLITIISYLCKQDQLKKTIGSNPNIFHALIVESVSIQTRSMAAAAFCSLTEIHEICMDLYKKGVMGLFLGKLKNEQDASVIKEAVCAICNLFMVDIIRDDVRMVEKVFDAILCKADAEWSLKILQLLMISEKASQKLADLGLLGLLGGFMVKNATPSYHERCMLIIEHIHKFAKNPPLESFREKQVFHRSSLSEDPTTIAGQGSSSQTK